MAQDSGYREWYRGALDKPTRVINQHLWWRFPGLTMIVRTRLILLAESLSHEL